MKSLRYAFAAMFLIVCTIMNFMIPASASPERGLVVDVLHEYVETGARGTKAPKEPLNLSNNDYKMSGKFEHKAYTNYKFMPDGNGELKYDIRIDYDLDVPDLHLQKGLKVEVYKKNAILEDKLVDSVQYKAAKVPEQDSIYQIYIEGSKTVTGLDPNTYYYIVITKANDGIYAFIDGTVSHP